MLPPVSLPMPVTWRDLLEELAPAFSRRSTRRLFVALACGMILADRSTVVAMAAAAGMAGKWRRACWFFSGAAWDIDELGLAVAGLVGRTCSPKVSRWWWRATGRSSSAGAGTVWISSLS